MVVCQVFGNDTTIGFAASQGNFQLNVFKPVLIHAFLQSVTLLADSVRSFDRHCVAGIQVNEARVAHLLQSSLMLVTALVPQCPNRECESLISELGCCRAALLSFLKRHPNPEIARLIQVQDKVQGCELIGRFRLN